MKTAAQNYLSNVYRSITQTTSVKAPSYGYFLEMLKTAVKADGGKIIGDSFFTIELPTMIIDSDEVYNWFSKK